MALDCWKKLQPIQKVRNRKKWQNFSCENQTRVLWLTRPMLYPLRQLVNTNTLCKKQFTKYVISHDWLIQFVSRVYISLNLCALHTIFYDSYWLRYFFLPQQKGIQSCLVPTMWLIFLIGMTIWRITKLPSKQGSIG